MLTMFTALEAAATSHLLTAEDYSFYQHLEIRILDSVQHGGTSIIHGGFIPINVRKALLALGYKIYHLSYDEVGEVDLYKISWEDSLHAEQSE